jgi:type III secretion system low calcium response chaperone LcrH/SycD
MAASTSPGAAAEIDLAEITRQILEGKTTIGEQRGLSPQHLEAVYAMAYNFYNQGKYDDAEKAFAFLVFYNHLDRRFWLGLAATQQMRKAFDGAVQAYAMASLLDINDPEVPLHAADCYLAMGQREATISALTAACHFSEGKPQFARIHQRATALLEQLEQGAASAS